MRQPLHLAPTWSDASRSRFARWFATNVLYMRCYAFLAMSAFPCDDYDQVPDIAHFDAVDPFFISPM